MKTPIVFLDIDGVLNSKQWFARLSHAPQRQTPTGEQQIWERMIDPACVACLNRLLDQTGAEVVVSSSWRKKHALDEIIQMLCEHGFRGQVIGMTPMGETESRAQEIALWIAQNSATDLLYVVLDDEAADDILSETLVRPSKETGLTDVDVALAIHLLAKKQQAA